jgi:hypothetical protein
VAGWEETPPVLYGAIASSARPLWSRLRRLDPKIALDERQIPLLAKRLHFFFLFTYEYLIRQHLDVGRAVEESLVVVILEISKGCITWTCGNCFLQQDELPQNSPPAATHQ